MSSILGVLFAMLVGMLVIPNYASFQQNSNENVRAAATAQQQKQLYAAATVYIQQNAPALQLTATATSPVTISVPMLQSIGQLAGFNATNPYAQTWQVQVLQPNPTVLQALVTATGGEVLADKQASKIASLVGATGGFVPQNDSGTFPGGAANAFGAFSGWQISAANYGIGGGHPAALLTVTAGQVSSNYLYRNAVPGQPQLNQMNTPLIMAAVQTRGTSCTTSGAIAQDGVGGILACQNNLYGQKFWLSSSMQCLYDTTWPDLNSLEDDVYCLNSHGNPNSPAGGEWFFMSVTRHVNATNYYVVQRVVGMTNGAAGRVWQRNQQSNTPGNGWGPWIQQADSQVSIEAGGNVKAAGQVSAASVAVGSSVLSGDSTNTTLSQTGQVSFQHPDGSAATIGQVGDVNSYNGTFATSNNWWSMVARDGSSGYNAQPQNVAGSLHVNDIYIRSVGKWASQMANYGFKGYQAVGNSGVAGTDGILMIQGGVNSNVYAYIDGVRVGLVDARNKYGQGQDTMTVPIASGSSWWITTDYNNSGSGATPSAFFMQIY